MSDFVDEANELVEMRIQNQLANLRAAQRVVSEEYCEDCCCDIPIQRQAIGGVTRCITCQQLYENEQKHVRK